MKHNQRYSEDFMQQLLLALSSTIDWLCNDWVPNENIAFDSWLMPSYGSVILDSNTAIDVLI